MVEQVPRAVLDYGPENLDPGDVIITNDPYPSGVHLNDVSLISPVFCDGELLGYVANLAHHVDVGGGAPASIGAFREVFQEGVIIPPVKIVEAGRIVPDVFRLLLAQIRSKHETAGDLRAQVAANTTGVRRLQALVERFGRETIVATMDELLDYTERRTRAEIAALPHGVYEAEGSVDTDGYTDEPVRLRARVEITAGGVRFDLPGSDPQRRAPVNSTYAQTFSACAYAVKCLVDPDLPVNDGFYRLVTVDAPQGSVTNCTWPSPVVGGWETQTRLVDVIFRALLPALPERMPAGTKAMMCHAGFGGIDAATGEYYCFLETFGGGYGARLASDGPDAVQTHGQNTENAPVEETELNYPVQVTRLSLVEDSDGPGRFRGGLGLRKDYLFSRPTTFTVLADRDKAGPWGVLGGLDGIRAEYLLVRDGEERRLGAKTTLDVEPGRRDQLPHLRRRRLRPAGRARPGPGRARRPRGQGERRARPRDLPRRDRLRRQLDATATAALRSGVIDPITFEVIRNALVAATDEMVLTLKRSAYSTNIKTRSDFSCAFFDAELRCSAQGFAQPVHLGSMVEQVPRAVRDYGPENLEPGDAIITNDPYPSGVHLNDVSLISPGLLRRRAARLRREPRPPRRRRRRRPGQHRRLPRGVPGGRHHPAGQDRRGRPDRPRRLPAAPRPDPLQARDRRRPPRADRRERDRRPQGAGARRALRARDDRRHDGRAARLHRAAHPRRARRRCPTASTRPRASVDNDGYTDEPVRLEGPGHGLARRTSTSTSPAPTPSAARRSTRPTR